jgi:hypothetical protein
MADNNANAVKVILIGRGTPPCTKKELTAREKISHPRRAILGDEPMHNYVCCGHE